MGGLEGIGSRPASGVVSSTATGFNPSAATIKVGGKVRWVNDHTSVHTVTSGS